MVAGPELSRTLTEFESTFKTNRGESAIRHHEQVPVVQSAFAKQVNALVSTIEEMGNPFLDESADLLVLDSKEILDDTVVRTVRNIETIVRIYTANMLSRDWLKRQLPYHTLCQNNSSHSSDVSFIHRMRHGVSLCRKRQTNCMGGVASWTLEVM